MNAILETLLWINLSSIVLFLAIVFLKRYLGSYMSAKFQYAMWFLLIIRLILPLNINIGFSLSNILPIWPRSVVKEVIHPAPRIPADSENIKIDKNIKNAEDHNNGIEVPLQGNLSYQYQGTSSIKKLWNDMNPFKASLSKIDIEGILLWLWGLGMLVMLRNVFRGYRKIRIIKKETVIYRNNRASYILSMCKCELSIKRDIPMVFQDTIRTPALTAWFRPVILLPIDVIKSCDDQELEFIITHELNHYKRWDHIIRLLLTILKTIYWFNPIAHIGANMMVADMETACDAAVTEKMEVETRRAYAHTLISLFNTNNSISCNGLAMSAGKSRALVEKRIRGMFMPRKTGISVKTISLILIGVLGLVCFTTACQPTPHKQIVVGKVGSELEDKINESATSAENGKSIGEVMGIPRQWSETFINQNGKVSFNINGEIDIPDVEKVPVAELSPIPFTQEQVDKMIEVLLGSNQLYEPQNLTREQIEEHILKLKAWIAEDKNEANNKMDDSFIMKLEAGLAAYEKQYRETPESVEKIPADSKIGFIEENEGYEGSYNGLNVMVDTEVGNMSFTVKSYRNYGFALLKERTADGVSFKEYYSWNLQEAVEYPEGVNISKKEAQRKAKDIAQALDDGLELAYTGVAGFIGDKGYDEHVWQMIFTRKINEFVTPFEIHEQGGDISVELTAPPVPYEKIIISINDKGIAEFQWQTPMKVDRIANENVALMPFKDLQERAKDILKNSFNQLSENYGDEVEHTNVYINYITLGFMRINEKGRIGGYRLVPVWDFYGYWQNEPKDTSDIPEEELDLQEVDYYPYNSLLTINAIDGSHIDRNKGY